MSVPATLCGPGWSGVATVLLIALASAGCLAAAEGSELHSELLFPLEHWHNHG